MIIISLPILLHGQRIINGKIARIFGLYLPVAIIFGDDVGAIVDIPGYISIYVLLDPPLKRIILILGIQAKIFHLDQPVLKVIMEEDGIRNCGDDSAS